MLSMPIAGLANRTFCDEKSFLIQVMLSLALRATLTIRWLAENR